MAVTKSGGLFAETWASREQLPGVDWWSPEPANTKVQPLGATSSAAMVL